jgi:hypothetical protein
MLSRRVNHAKGTRENPLTPDELHRKYLALATTVTTAAHAERIAETVRGIDRAPDVTALASLLRRPAPARASRAQKGGGARSRCAP